MITTADLKAQTRRELADMARGYGVAQWHSLRKDDLIAEIKKVQRKMRRQAGTTTAANAKAKSARATGQTKKTKTAAAAKPKSTATAAASRSSNLKASARNGSAKTPVQSKSLRSVPKSSSVSKSSSSAAAKKSDQRRLNKPMPKLPEPKVDPKTARIRAQIKKRRETMQKNRDLSTGTLVAGSAMENGTSRTRGTAPHQDRVILLVRDAYWLQATWEITRASIQRAQASLAERWLTATPTLRLLHVGSNDGSTSESVAREIQIHGGVNNWYIDVDDPPSRFRVAVGYSTTDGEFYTLCRSNVVETPRPNECERLDEHWHDIAEDYERIYSLSGGYETDGGDLKEVFEERLARAMPQRGDQGQTVSEPSLLRQGKLPFKVDAELIVFGKSVPSASVQVGDRPVKLQPDGSFTVRMELPDKRQVLAVTAESRDGLRQRKTVIAVERNTKVMEAVELDEPF